ncbi:MCE family protein [Streptomyces sp. NPDC050504]|uniref:MCE family protein n=1 Tax=Streptomyces sp. NPDC050504 TaxID=3365618 RepID=UPI00379DC3F4
MQRRRAVAIGAGIALIATVATTGVMALDDSDSTVITAYFPSATGVYEGSDLRILGVKVGTVDSVEPQGDEVKVVLLLDEGVKVPKAAHAVVVMPSVVADRYIQLAPAYTSGPEIEDGAVLPAAGNSTPVEVDQLYASITELTEALGPGGANSKGALTGLFETGAKNLDGNGKAIGDSIAQFGKATRTLNGSSKDLFDTLAQLQTFTSMLKNKDAGVRTAQTRLGQVSTFLAQDKENLGAALKELGKALAQVKGFIQKNRGEIKKNVEALVPITRTLVDQRAALAEAMDAAPLAAGNVLNAYDPVHRTIDGRTNLLEISALKDPQVPASALAGLAPVDAGRRQALPVLPLPPVGTVYGTPDRTGKPGTTSGGAR